MKKACILLLLLAFAISGCATTVNTVRHEADFKQDPRKVEREANEALKCIVQAWVQGDATQLARWDPQGLIQRENNDGPQKTFLDLVEEAVWIGKDTVMIRTSWAKDGNAATGSEAKRHTANFIFKAASPVTLMAIEGESPF